MQRNQGFTIIELLVVIAIIGLLSSVVLTSLQTSKASARESTTLSTLIQIKKALEVYAVSHGGYPNEANNYNATSFPTPTFDPANKFNDFLTKKPPDGFLGEFFTKVLQGPGNKTSSILNYYHYFTRNDFDSVNRSCGNMMATKYILAVRSDEPLNQIPKLYSSGEGCGGGWCANYYCITSNY